MEGILWKWTNYWNGWQTRWFVLENGILSYYKSQEEVNQGCKGSVKVSVCQINVNNIDSTRLDLVIPGQQHMYLRAPSPQDRQKWLVALGSAKACVDSKADIKGWQTRWFVLENGILSYYKSQEEVNQGCKGSVKVSVCQINVNNIDSTRLDLVIPGQQHMYLRAPSPQDRQKWLVALGSAKACVDSKADIKEYESKWHNLNANHQSVAVLEDPNSLSHKKSELILYCDLMMQQVHAVKSATTAEDGPELQKIEEASSLLTATCDTFIRTLEDIMKLTSNSTITVPYETPIPITAVKNNCSKIPRQSIARSISQENR